jgi:hypothetical protein
MKFRTIDKAPREEGEPLMLYCGEQGGWHSGTWFEGRWVDFLTLEEELFPSHYAEMLSDPVDEGDERATAWEATRAFG